MIKAIVVLLGILLLRIIFPRRQRRTNTTATPYGSVFDVAVPAELACSAICDQQTQSSRMTGWSSPSNGAGSKSAFAADRNQLWNTETAQ